MKKSLKLRKVADTTVVGFTVLATILSPIAITGIAKMAVKEYVAMKK